jgi:hypothetical protein
MIHIYVSSERTKARCIKSGMFARVSLTTGAERGVSALPLSAVRGEGATAVMSGSSRRPSGAARRSDRPARRALATVEIVSGVLPAEPVLATKFDNSRMALA